MRAFCDIMALSMLLLKCVVSIKLEKVPDGIHQRAAQLLEDAVGTESAPGWDEVELLDDVRELFRPDIEDVAYYEFRVRSADNDPKGFIIASATHLDHPIAHWDFQGFSPTELLDVMSDGKIKKYYKLDALSYAGENARGDLVANIGGLPPDIVGLTPDLADKAGQVVHASSLGPADDDGSPPEEDPEFGPDPELPWHFATEEEGTRRLGQNNWRKHKDDYKTKYHALIDDLERNAYDDWKTEEAASENGEGLLVDEPFSIALRFKLDSFEVSNTGKDMVTVELEPIKPGKDKLTVTASEAKPNEDALVDVTLVYVNGKTETRKFFIVPLKDIEDADEEDGGRRSLSSVHWADGARELWSSWYYYWAGSHADQRLYRQLRPNESPNTSGCYSGCGATAWAMLFGWGDFQATKNSKWAGRWGLYRVDGGYGADAVAPKYTYTGMKNVIWEIRNYIKSGCESWVTTNSWTYPDNMQLATKYFSGRTGTSWTMRWNSFGFSSDDIFKHARDAIRYRQTPAVIGIGFLSHYPLAYGMKSRYRWVKTCIPFYCWNERKEWEREFYVNQGNGGTTGWEPSSIWFSGSINP